MTADPTQVVNTEVRRRGGGPAAAFHSTLRRPPHSKAGNFEFPDLSMDTHDPPPCPKKINDNFRDMYLASKYRSLQRRRGQTLSLVGVGYRMSWTGRTHTLRKLVGVRKGPVGRPLGYFCCPGTAPRIVRYLTTSSIPCSDKAVMTTGRTNSTVESSVPQYGARSTQRAYSIFVM
ncbi:hypothetical protein E2C01_048071 [Portunus trituberculatus]|uniref:Uncharacterized protein n=1 Tax=Portunus trituberculatus TaxID=210409 RepID=A0A5B7GA73_PORTR|nr:hypothetical protein [Portunus trituberculatus]